jgi:hypothetical protein
MRSKLLFQNGLDPAQLALASKAARRLGWPFRRGGALPKGDRVNEAAAAGGRTPTGDPEAFARAHRALLADRDIQFDFARYVPSRPPRWLVSLFHWIETLGPGLRIAFWVVVGLVVLALLYGLFRWFQGSAIHWPWRHWRDGGTTEAWRPEAEPARALLAEADALAAQGDYDGAAHLLLFRSIEEIDRKRPALVRPARTSRDLADEVALPPGPRGAFARIVMAVERSLFGRRHLAEPDWRDCRAAYEDFAFSPEWAR